MTSAALRLASPTSAERVLLRAAGAVATGIQRRRELRAARQRAALEQLREQRALRTTRSDLDIALLSLGSRPR
jgi:hypothetical protein